jgi:hypothetical protein
LTRKPTNYSYSLQQLNDITSYDNRKKIDNVHVSSEVIMEMGGAEKIARGLNSDIKIGITGSAEDIL